MTDAEFERRFAEADRLIQESRRTESPDAIDAAIAALGTLEEGLRPRLSFAVSGNLAFMRLKRFEVRGESARDDLDAAIQALEWLVARDRPDEPSMVMRLGALARALRVRYTTGGGIDDLEGAIARLRQFVAAEPPPAPLADAQADLARALLLRWNARRQEHDLLEALACYAAAESSVTDPFGLGALHNSWGTALIAQLDLHGDDRVLHDAIARFEAAEKAYPANAPGRREPLNNLAEALRRRALARRDQEPERAAADLDRAIAIMRDLLKTEAPPVVRAEWRHNLAAFLMARDGEDDLAEAEEMLAQAREEPGVQGPSRATFDMTEGSLLRMRHDRGGSDDHLRRSAAAYDRASQQTVDVSTALVSARSLGAVHAELGDWPSAAAAYQRAVQLAEIAYRGLGARATKERWLREVSGLPQLAAVALARAGDARAAVEALERTRTMILSESLGRRDAELDALVAAAHDEPAESFTTALTAWERARAAGAGEVEAEARVDAAVEGIRALPGFERFLVLDAGAALSQLARERLIVLLAVGGHGGVALVARDDDVTAVPLPAFHDGDAPVWEEAAAYFGAYEGRDHDRDGWFAGLERLTGWMGSAVMEPLVGHLGEARECTFVPTGVLALFPWHAAWRTVDGRRLYWVDSVAASYGPSVQTLLASRQPTDVASLLAVEEPAPVSQGSLPAASLEIKAVSAHFSPARRLHGEEATVEAVLDGLGVADCAHFACHGVAFPTSPADSFLLMAHDQPLAVGAITGRTGERLAADLMVLSACESAVPGLAVIDELVGLPSALLERGAGAVVGSLWVAPDAATALLMTRMVWSWRKGGMKLPLALQDAQRWLRGSSNAEIAAWLREAEPENDGHCELAAAREAGPGNAVPFAEPAYWAAFVYVGR